MRQVKTAVRVFDLGILRIRGLEPYSLSLRIEARNLDYILSFSWNLDHLPFSIFSPNFITKHQTYVLVSNEVQ